MGFGRVVWELGLRTVGFMVEDWIADLHTIELLFGRSGFGRLRAWATLLYKYVHACVHRGSRLAFGFFLHRSLKIVS
jgi:hypothetical protein